MAPCEASGGAASRGRVAVLATLLAAGCATAPGGGRTFSPGFDPSPAEEWITLRDFRYVTAVGVTERMVYLGSTEGVERFDTLRDAWLSPVTDADGLPRGGVTALVADPATGDAWVGTPRGLVRIFAVDGRVESVFGPPPTRVDVLGLEPDGGTVWARVGGFWWSGGGGAVFQRAAGSPPPGLRGSTRAADLDPSRIPWLDPLFVDSAVAFGRTVRLTAVDRDLRGDWYAGTWGDNGRRWGAGIQAWEPLLYGLAGPSGGPVVRATDGLWFFPGAEGDAAPVPRSGPGVSFGGPAAPAAAARAADRLQRWSYTVPRLDPGLPTAVARAAAASGDTVWLGTDLGLVRGIGGRWRVPDASFGSPTEPVDALAVDGERVWLGTRSGLVVWDRAAQARGDRLLRGRSVTAIVVAADAIFVGTGGAGLFAGRRDVGPAAADPGGGVPATIERVESRGSRIHALALAGDRLLVASDVGFEAFDRVTGTWRRLRPDDGRLGAVPLALAVDDGRVWIGSARGLTLWRPETDTWRTWTEADGLAGTPVVHLLVDGDAVWASTPDGTSRFDWRGNLEAR